MDVIVSREYRCCFIAAGLFTVDDSAYDGHQPRLYATLLELSGLGKAKQQLEANEDRKEKRDERIRRRDLENESKTSKNGQKLDQNAQ